MTAILIVAHGTLADSLVHCVTHVFGQCPEGIEALGVSPSDCADTVAARIRARVAALDRGDGVLVFTDMYGATPSNGVCRVLEPGRVEGVSGVNLPMLLRAVTYRQEPAAALAARVLDGGRDGILHITREICDAP